MSEHKRLVYWFQALVLLWDPLPRFISVVLLINFLLLWAGSWLSTWSILTASSLYGLGWLCLETFPLSMPVYDSTAPIPDTVNPETPAGRDRGLKTLDELAEGVDRVGHIISSCLALLKAFQRAHPRRFFAEVGSLLVLTAVLGTKLGTPRLLCLICTRCKLCPVVHPLTTAVNAALFYPGLARRGLIQQWLSKVPADKLRQVEALANRVLDAGTVVGLDYNANLLTRDQLQTPRKRKQLDLYAVYISILPNAIASEHSAYRCPRNGNIG